MRDSKTGEEENILSREWQQTRFKKYVLPDAVYYQSLWAVRDLERMEERIKELSDDKQKFAANYIYSLALVSFKKLAPDEFSKFVEQNLTLLENYVK